MKQKVVFLDRDGVINKYPGHFKYVTRLCEFKFLPRVKTALKKLDTAGFKLFVISNQAGIAKKIYSRKTLDTITNYMAGELKRSGVGLSGVFYCTHHPEENCACRKPKTGLIKLAEANLKVQGLAINRRQSFLVGDSIQDIQTGKEAGLKTILVFSGKEKPQNRPQWETLPDFTARDLAEAADIVVQCR